MGCPQTDYNLRTQAMVDAFPQNCDSVLGDMIVEGSDITNVDALANLTSVGDGLKIRGNSSLTNIDALANLTSVGGALNINSNAALTNIDGLANLTKVVQGLEINSNASLTNIDGLANVAGSTSGILEINNNAALTNIDGLANLTRVAGFLKIQGNAALTNLDGLASLTSVGGDLLISGNDNASCEGLALLLGWPSGPPDDAVAGDIAIVSNGSGCNSVDQILAPLSKPTKPSIVSTDYEAGQITLTVSESDNVNANVTQYDATCTDGTSTYTGTSASSPITVSGLTNDVAYTCTVTATNSVGNKLRLYGD